MCRRLPRPTGSPKWPSGSRKDRKGRQRPEADAPKAMKTPPAPEPEPIETPADTVQNRCRSPTGSCWWSLPGPAPHGLTRCWKRRVSRWISPPAPGDDGTTGSACLPDGGADRSVPGSAGDPALPPCSATSRTVVSRPSLAIVASHNGLISRLRAWFCGLSPWLQIPLKPSQLWTSWALADRWGNQAG